MASANWPDRSPLLSAMCVLFKSGVHGRSNRQWDNHADIHKELPATLNRRPPIATLLRDCDNGGC